VNQEQLQFLYNVEQYVSKHPELSAHVVSAASSGVESAMKRMQSLACDCETLAIMALARRNKSTDAAILSKMKQLQGRSFFVWDSDIEELEAKMANKSPLSNQ